MDAGVISPSVAGVSIQDVLSQVLAPPLLHPPFWVLISGRSSHLDWYRG